MASLSDYWNQKFREEKILKLMRAKNEQIEHLVQAENEARRKNELSYLDQEEDPLGSGLANGCTSSNQCASGYACVNGECQLIDDGSNSGGNSGAGSGCEDDNGNCNSGGPDACQQTPTCGEEEEARECCGDRCCYYGSNASPKPGVHCECGECPPLPECNEWCAAYFLANGEPGAGCQEGEFGNSCNLCTECFAGTCQPISAAFAPCFCAGSECDPNGCLTCNINPEDAEFGNCEFDLETTPCQTCQTVKNYECPCGFTLASITHCVGYYENPWPGLHERARALCRELVEEGGLDPDTCGCTTDVQCNCDDDCPPCHYCPWNDVDNNGRCARLSNCNCGGEFDMGFGTYTIEYRIIEAEGELKQCSNNATVAPATSSDVLYIKVYTDIYGLRIENLGGTSAFYSCFASNAATVEDESYLKFWTRSSEGAVWALDEDFTAPDGRLPYTGNFYSGNNKESSAVVVRVLRNGEEVESGPCPDLETTY